jgi:hypothetical protein
MLMIRQLRDFSVVESNKGVVMATDVSLCAMKSNQDDEDDNDNDDDDDDDYDKDVEQSTQAMVARRHLIEHRGRFFDSERSMRATLSWHWSRLLLARCYAPRATTRLTSVVVASDVLSSCTKTTTTATQPTSLELRTTLLACQS